MKIVIERSLKNERTSRRGEIEIRETRRRGVLSRREMDRGEGKENANLSCENIN